MADSGLYGPLTSSLAKQLARAKEMSAAEGWDESEELERRTEWFKDQVTDLKWDRAKYKRAPLKIRTTDDPDQIEARSFNTFWDIIKRAKVRYLRSEPRGAGRARADGG